MSEVSHNPQTPTKSIELEWEFRWDVSVGEGTGSFGRRFFTEWKRLLKAQRLGGVVGAAIPHRIQMQFVVTPEVTDEWANLEAGEVQQELLRFWDSKTTICTKPRQSDAGGWQGVRLWIAFRRQEIEAILSTKTSGAKANSGKTRRTLR